MNIEMSFTVSLVSKAYGSSIMSRYKVCGVIVQRKKSEIHVINVWSPISDCEVWLSLFLFFLA